ncbi:ribonuclease R, partial [Reticulomyxa filosa]
LLLKKQYEQKFIFFFKNKFSHCAWSGDAKKQFKIKSKWRRNSKANKIVFFIVKCFVPTFVLFYQFYLKKYAKVRNEFLHSKKFMKNNLNSCQFSKEVEESVSKLEVTSKDFENRKDLRKSRIFTIDPTNSKDFDDALSIETIDTNKYRIGVHIADVSHFVRPGTLVDAEARNRATSVYLVDRVLHMLPTHLSTDLCSLNPDADRLTFSLFVNVDENCQVLEEEGSPWFGRTVIRSQARLNYETAHFMIEDDEKQLKELHECVKISSDTTLEQIKTDIQLMYRLAEKKKQKRLTEGAVRLKEPKLRFELKTHHQVEKNFVLVFEPAAELKSSGMVEEMMLLANTEVAKQ